jgi:hypothetical protein
VSWQWPQVSWDANPLAESSVDGVKWEVCYMSTSSQFHIDSVTFAVAISQE